MDFNVVLARRQSPPWAELARLLSNGIKIDPSLYVPDYPIPGFPNDVASLISVWDNMFSIGYFRCRAALGAIADRNNLLSNTRKISYADDLSDGNLLPNSIIFFHDDDDLFDPKISHHLSKYSTDKFDVVKFPLFRINSDLFTFTPDGVYPDLVLGRTQEFHFRYQTNNYGILNSRVADRSLLAMKDHVEASHVANELCLIDESMSRPLSATIKTPLSASMLPRLLDGKDSVLSDIRGFRNACNQTGMPPEYDWLARCLQDYSTLFELIEKGEDEHELSRLLPGV